MSQQRQTCSQESYCHYLGERKSIADYTDSKAVEAGPRKCRSGRDFARNVSSPFMTKKDNDEHFRRIFDQSTVYSQARFVVLWRMGVILKSRASMHYGMTQVITVSGQLLKKQGQFWGLKYNIVAQRDHHTVGHTLYSTGGYGANTILWLKVISCINKPPYEVSLLLDGLGKEELVYDRFDIRKIKTWTSSSHCECTQKANSK